MSLKSTSLLALHVQRVSHIDQNDYFYSKDLLMNVDENGELACQRSSKPYTNAQTPGHTIPSGYTPSGKWRPAKSVPSKMDRRVGK